MSESAPRYTQKTTPSGDMTVSEAPSRSWPADSLLEILPIDTASATLDEGALKTLISGMLRDWRGEWKNIHSCTFQAEHHHTKT
ncbi:ferredoxin:oxidoreductase FAD/NAD(P)-binding:molybdopterin oxidoreductase [Anopheles sinensis]|uniref:Ferredoxin:oxidoreductase FAD/NAD(P)-binding:molybdopterin oxidoreductase n=1 Tax=Anopheles sinensis TaxID=74873 RepID=A0A084WJA7_ANOSI|nr:ferredoxin:oxidoreductase FAD/NAD(P)-binding:molybdopterin oxidoreductase [Anopheles sinensis]